MTHKPGIPFFDFHEGEEVTERWQLILSFKDFNHSKSHSKWLLCCLHDRRYGLKAEPAVNRRLP